MTATAGVSDRRVPGYLGRVLDGEGAPVGTCFQVAPGVLVTAWHVLDGIRAAGQDAQVKVDPLAGGEAFEAAVARLDQAHDLAVLISGVPLPATAGDLAATDQIAPRAGVTVTGHSVIADPGRTARSLTTIGQWTGSAIWENATPTGRMTAEALMPGMSGAPVIRDGDGAVAGVVSGRYNTADGWLARTVWVARTEDLAVLLEGIAEVAVQDAGSVRPAGSVRVSDAEPRRLGVHAAISVAGVPDELPPEYVPRDVDAAEFGVRARVAAAAERGGFVLLVGGSSVGKTRCAVEAVKALLPDWWLVHPDGPGQVAALAAAPTPRMVVWLDELQRYLHGEHGLTGGMVRALLNPPHCAVIIGTLWPDRYSGYTALPALGGADPQAREREVLDMAAVVRISPEFSPAEQDKARAAAARDRRLAIALESARYGLTQTLAAAPQLVARWEDARTGSPYAWAVLTAALDAARLSARAPLSADFLRAAAPGYCTPQQQAEAPDNWLEQALAYATEKLHGAAAALSPAGSGMGQVTGYTVADYLIQHAIRERRHARVPASTWDAVVSHIRDPADAAWLADSASARLLYRYAIPLSHRAADAGDGYSAWLLTELLAQREDLDGLRARTEVGDSHAAMKLTRLLAEHGDLDEAAQILRAMADAGDKGAAKELARVLAKRGDLDEAAQILRAMADAGDNHAVTELVWLLKDRDDLDEAAQILRAMADAGDNHASRELARVLAERGDLDGLRARADVGDNDAARRLADLLKDRGDLDEAAQILRAMADAGDKGAAWNLARLLAEHGDLDGLRGRADAGDNDAAWELAGLLAKREDVDGLRALADAGNNDAAEKLIVLLAEHGDLDGLRARADAGDNDAARRLADLLKDRGDLDGLRALADAANSYAAWRLAELLAERGDLDGLRARADAGDSRAAWLLAELLAKRGDLDGLRARADAGDSCAAEKLAERGDLDGLRALADAGDGHAARKLAELLAKRGDLDEATQILRGRADAGDGDAAWELAGLLAKREDVDGLRALADAGDGHAARELAGLLAKREDVDGLRALADVGDEDAAEELAGLLAKREDVNGLRALADAGDGHAAWELARLLYRRSNLEGLRALADGGDEDAAEELAARGDLDGLRARADAGDNYAAEELARLLAEHGDLDGAEQILRAQINVRDKGAAWNLARLLTKQGRGEEAERLGRFGLNPNGSTAWK
jgi:hypothetical protein